MATITICSGCNGRGTIQCPVCNGRGSVSKAGILPGWSFGEQVECTGCHGTGKLLCSLCGGVGKTQSNSDENDDNSIWRKILSI